MVQCRIPELLPLIVKLQNAVAEHQIKNDLVGGLSWYIEYKIASDFTYGNDGVTARGGLTGKTVVESDWTMAGAVITRELRTSAEFTSAIDALAKLNGSSGDGDTPVSNLIYILAPKLIGGIVRTEAELLSEIDHYLDVVSSPVKVEAKVELTGMFLEVPQIQLSDVLLRQTRRSDLEKKISVFSPRTEAVRWPYPGIIGEISVSGLPNKIHDVVPKLVAMLRLFAVASVNCSVYWYSLGSQSAPQHHPGTHSVPALTALIRSVDEPRLKQFWSLLYPVMPQNLYEPIPRTVDYLLVAYQRYCAAILRRDSFEERVANVVMGLEALFIVKHGEGAKRCRLRTARALSYLGENEQEVLDRLVHAYEARNAFAHGDLLSPIQQQNMATKFSDWEVIFRSAANYLRKALVASILIPVTKSTVTLSLDQALATPSNNTNTSALFRTAATVV